MKRKEPASLSDDESDSDPVSDPVPTAVLGPAHVLKAGDATYTIPPEAWEALKAYEYFRAYETQGFADAKLAFSKVIEFNAIDYVKPSSACLSSLVRWLTWPVLAECKSESKLPKRQKVEGDCPPHTATCLLAHLDPLASDLDEYALYQILVYANLLKPFECYFETMDDRSEIRHSFWRCFANLPKKQRVLREIEQNHHLLLRPDPEPSTIAVALHKHVVQTCLLSGRVSDTEDIFLLDPYAESDWSHSADVGDGIVLFRPDPIHKVGECVLASQEMAQQRFDEWTCGAFAHLDWKCGFIAGEFVAQLLQASPLSDEARRSVDMEFWAWRPQVVLQHLSAWADENKRRICYVRSDARVSVYIEGARHIVRVTNIGSSTRMNVLMSYPQTHQMWMWSAGRVRGLAGALVAQRTKTTLLHSASRTHADVSYHALAAAAELGFAVKMPISSGPVLWSFSHPFESLLWTSRTRFHLCPTSQELRETLRVTSESLSVPDCRGQVGSKQGEQDSWVLDISRRSRVLIDRIHLSIPTRLDEILPDWTSRSSPCVRRIDFRRTRIESLAKQPTLHFVLQTPLLRLYMDTTHKCLWWTKEYAEQDQVARLFGAWYTDLMAIRPAAAKLMSSTGLSWNGVSAYFHGPNTFMQFHPGHVALGSPMSLCLVFGHDVTIGEIHVPSPLKEAVAKTGKDES